MLRTSSKLCLAAAFIALSSFSVFSRAAAQDLPGQTERVPQPGELGSPFSVDHFWNHIGFEVSGGYSPVVQKGTNHFDSGYNITAGIVDHLSPRWSLLGEAQFFGLKGVNYAPDSSSISFAFDLATSFDFIPRAKTSPYIIGGVGFYQFATGVLCNAVGDCETISDHSAGYNGGLGVRHRLYQGRLMEIFAEGRYHYIASGSTDFGQISLLPVSAGIRW